MSRVFLTTLILAAVLSGCAEDRPLRSPDLVIIGVDPDQGPFVSRDSVDGSITGFDVELISTICQACRWRCEFRPMVNGDLQEALIDGDIDIAVGDISGDPDRITRSDPYYLTGLVMIVASAQPLPAGEASWQGKLVAVPGQVPGNALAFGLKDAQVRAYNNADSAASEVEAGRVAALVADYTTSRRIVSSRPALQIVPGMLTTAYYTVAMRAADTLRMNRFNDALASLCGGYTYEQLHMKWFGYPLLNVAVPDSVSARWKVR